jgi:uncharacterized protein with HEPN domain
MQRRDDLYLADIVEAADSIRLFLAMLQQSDRGGFVKDDLVRSAVLQKLSVIGEAAARVSDGLRALYPDVPWHQARGMRNLLVHPYFSVNWEIVWKTATESVPKLAAQVAVILESQRSVE